MTNLDMADLDMTPEEQAHMQSLFDQLSEDDKEWLAKRITAIGFDYDESLTVLDLREEAELERKAEMRFDWHRALNVPPGTEIAEEFWDEIWSKHRDEILSGSFGPEDLGAKPFDDDDAQHSGHPADADDADEMAYHEAMRDTD